MDNNNSDEYVETIILEDEDGNSIEFIEIANIEYEGKMYSCLEKYSEEETEDEGVMYIFEISKTEDGILLPVNDEKIVDAVFDECIKMIDARGDKD